MVASLSSSLSLVGAINARVWRAACCSAVMKSSCKREVGAAVVATEDIDDTAT